MWPVLAVLCGALVLASGLLVAWRGHRWRALSVRYEARPDREADPARVAGSMWSALDRGDDPTRDPAEEAGADAAADPADPTQR